MGMVQILIKEIVHPSRRIMADWPYEKVVNLNKNLILLGIEYGFFQEAVNIASENILLWTSYQQIRMRA